MAVGVLLDTFLVRSLLIPALIVLVWPASVWPAGASRPGGTRRTFVRTPPSAEALRPGLVRRGSRRADV